MPHLLHSARELDTRYSPLTAPPDDGLADVADDLRDGVYQHGLTLASEIRDQVTSQGRRRRPLGLVQHPKDVNSLAVAADPRELDWLKHGARNVTDKD